MKPITRTEGLFLAWLWLNWAYVEQQMAALLRAVLASYDTPAFRRVQAATLRTSPFMRRLVLP